MPQETNVATIVAAYDAIAKADMAALAATLAPGFERHDLGATVGAGTGDELLDFIAALKSAMPDFTISVDKAITTEDDHVAILLRMSGTHEGPILGHEPTGRFIQIWGMSIYRMVDGLIKDNWQLLDTHGLMNQLQAQTAAA
jgi:steroid delta-isomerase-like uncharacterized protein